MIAEVAGYIGTVLNGDAPVIELCPAERIAHASAPPEGIEMPAINYFQVTESLVANGAFSVSEWQVSARDTDSANAVVLSDRVAVALVNRGKEVVAGARIDRVSLLGRAMLVESQGGVVYHLVLRLRVTAGS